jgi:hypothetical protein
MEIEIAKILNRPWQLAIEYLRWIEANDRYTPLSLLGLVSIGLLFMAFSFAFSIAFSHLLSR